MSQQIAEIDRLSNLPEELIHRILSNLETIQVVRTCLLSKKWRNIWASMPYLQFNTDDYTTSFVDKPYDPDKFWKYIRWVLLLRQSCQIRKLLLSCEDCEEEPLDELLHVVAYRNIQRLDIFPAIKDGKLREFRLPYGICKSLQELDVNFSNFVRLRASETFSNLKRLKMNKVELPGDYGFQDLLRDANALEELFLEQCDIRQHKILYITTAPNLKYFTFVNKWRFHGPFRGGLIVSAPKLVSFQYQGPILCDYILPNLSSLEKAKIDFMHDIASKDGQLVLCTMIEGLKNAKTLNLSDPFLKLFGPGLDELVSSISLCNLSRLTLESCCTAREMEGLINILNLSPNLEILNITLAERFKGGDILKLIEELDVCTWRSRMEDVICLSHHVRVVKISNFTNWGIAKELLKFMFQNGKVLKELQIVYKSEKIKKEIRFKIREFPRASPNLLISYIKSDD